MLLDDIKNYAKQFEYEPLVENPSSLKLRRAGVAKFTKFLVCGMGGSHLAADILKAWHPELDIIVWPSYGLPALREKDLKERLVIISSYSGTTEEAIDAFNAARAKHLTMVVIAARGKLINLAQKFKVPYVQMPDFHMQPRMATGLSLKAILAAIGEKAWLAEAKTLAAQLHPAREERRGKDLAKRLFGSVPVIYASMKNAAIAHNWKIKFNETGKIPAFDNFLSEMNHNEMTGFDAKMRTAALSRHFHFVFLKDGTDDRRITKRFGVLEHLLHDRGFKVEIVLLEGKTELHKIFNALVFADWTAYHTAKLYGVEAEQVPMVEEFKKSIG